LNNLLLTGNPSTEASSRIHYDAWVQKKPDGRARLASAFAKTSLLLSLVNRLPAVLRCVRTEEMPATTRLAERSLRPHKGRGVNLLKQFSFCFEMRLARVGFVLTARLGISFCAPQVFLFGHCQRF
jgi:hypothetical protein